MNDPIVEAVALAIYDNLHACGVPLKDTASLKLASIAIAAHLAALEAAGRMVAPIEPTYEMILSGNRNICSAIECTCDESRVYLAMIAARPR